jgi:hypothetical protein
MMWIIAVEQWPGQCLYRPPPPRYQFFLQLKLDLLSGKLECPYATSVELAAASLQCQSQQHALFYCCIVAFSAAVM